MALTVAEIKSLEPKEKAYRRTDGQGLYLEVRPTGTKCWRYKYRFNGKEKLLSIGTFPEISLAQARREHQIARLQLAEGVDPSAAKQLSKLMGKVAAADSFEAIGEEWIEFALAGKSESHIARSTRLLRKELFPFIGQKPVSELKAPELLVVLRAIEQKGRVDTAHRARQVAGQVLTYAIQTGRAERNVAKDLYGALRTHTQVHRAAIIDDTRLLGQLLLDMEQSDSSLPVKVAMQLSPLLFQRPGEIRAMEWGEINWELQRWEIASEKMKSRRPHIVPLARQALALLRSLQPLTGRSKYVFPSLRGASRYISENTVRIAIRNLGYGKDVITPHGFRATARTLLDEQLGFRVDWIEHQLAHAVKDATGRAYNRTSHLEGRTEMMQAWADYLDELKSQVGRS